MKQKFGVAIDIGASKVSVLVGENCDGGRVRIVAGCCVPLKTGYIRRGDIENVNEVGEALKKAILTIEREDNIKINRATIGITGRNIICERKIERTYVTRCEEIGQEDVDTLYNNVLRFSSKEGFSVIDILPMGYSIDEKKITDNPIGAAGSRLSCDFNIIYGDNSKLNFLRRALMRAGVEVVDMVPFAFASAAAVLTEEDKELGVCLVDIGATTIELAIYKDKKIKFSAALPYGASLINNDIKCYGILERHVESLKVQFGSAITDAVPDNVDIEIPSISSVRNKYISQRTLSRIIEARVNELVKAVKELIMGSGYAGQISEGVVITGGGAKLANIDRVFKKILNVEVRIGTPDVRVNGVDNDIIYDARFSTAIGVLLLGFERGEDMEVEFIESEGEKKEVVNNIANSEIETVSSEIIFPDDDDAIASKVKEKCEEMANRTSQENNDTKRSGGKLEETEDYEDETDEEDNEDDEEEEEVEIEVEPIPKRNPFSFKDALDKILQKLVQDEK